MFARPLSPLLVIVLLVLLLLFVYTLYSPGFEGPFIFDDYPNLSQIASVGGVSDWDSFKAYVFGGFSGPTGRPVSLASFLVNTTSWPADAYGFKVINVLIHLINGLLVFLLSRLFLRGLKSPSCNSAVSETRLSLLALLCAAIWLLHPYLTSTTLYVIQRMAMLSALFCLLGMYLYLRGREYLSERPRLGLGFMVAGVVFGTVLAVLSKENGAVLVLLIFIYEVTLGTRSPIDSRSFRAFRVLFLVVPSLMLVGYLVFIAYRNGFFANYSTRDFSPFERLLTQTRVIFSYLKSWFIPDFSGGRLFYDDVQVSRGWLSPWTTLASVVAIVLLSSVAIVYRAKWPLLSFAFLFFLGSQLVESTTVGLEIKFDHRIYLGSAFLSLPLIVIARDYLPRRARWMLTGVVLVTLSIATYSASTLWGSYEKMTLVWAAKQPASVRAQTEAAQMQFNAGRHEASLRILDEAAQRMPDSFRLRLTQALVQCQFEVSPADALASAKHAARQGPYRYTDFGLLDSFFVGAISRDCKGISLDDFMILVAELLQSTPNLTPTAQTYAQLHYYFGLGLLRAGSFDLAQEHLAKSLESRASLHMRMNIAAQKANVGLLNQALTEAKYVRDRLESGDIRGRAYAESPRLEDVLSFIDVVTADLEKLAD